MQKYDDFGRPIYETAEEYNRAHKTGGGAVIQNQTAAQRHATREGSKRAKTLVIGIVAFVIALNVVIIFSMSNMIGSVGAQPEPVYPNTWEEDYVEYSDNAETPLPDGFETFFYNGQFFTLPTTCSEIAKMGYDIVEYEPTDMIPSGFGETIALFDEDGYTVAMISVRNDTDDDVPFEECTVNYFYIDNPARYDETLDVPDFVFADGLTLESSYEEVEAYFGEPYYHYEDHSDEEYLYDSYQWEYYGLDERHFVMVNFVNGEMLDVSIEKEYYE